MNVTRIDTFSGHRDCVYTLVRAPDTHLLYSAGGDGYVIEWDLTRPDLGRLLARAGASVYALAVDEKRENLWVGQNYEGIRVLKPAEGKEISSFKITSSAIFDILIRGENAYVAFGDGVIGVVDVPAMAVRRHVRTSQQSVRALAANPQAGHIAAGFSDWHVRIFEEGAMNPVANLAGHQNSVFAVAYTPDGNFLLTAGRDAHLKVWDVKDGYRLAEDIVAHMYAINHIAFSPDGSLFATCSMDKSIKVWDAATFRLKKVIDRSRHAGHGTSVNKLLWTDFNDYLLAGSDDRMISVWQVSP